MTRSTADERRRRPATGAGIGVALRPENRAHTGGRPLEPVTRRQMEERLGHDFGSVRVHDDSEAATAAEAIGAHAFTRGEHVVLGRGHGGSASLLAHELAHVVQQRLARTLEPRISRPGEASEAAAGANRAAGGAGSPASVPAVQRQAAPGAADFRLKQSPRFQRAVGWLVVDGFPLGESTLSADQKSRIRAHASILNGLLDTEPGARVSVTGHGDAVGTEERNEVVGAERAGAVAAELVKAGVPPEVVDTESAGSSSPAVPAKGAEARNRRAVIRFSPPLRRFGFETPRLTPPTLDFGLKPAKPDLTLAPPLKPKIELMPGVGGEPEKPGPRGDKLPPEPTFDWKRAEDMVRRAREIEKRLPKSRTPLERLGDAAVEVLDPLIKKLPISDDLKKKAREGIRAGVEKGTEKACEAAIDASGLPGEAAEGAKAVCKGLLKTQPSGPGGDR